MVEESSVRTGRLRRTKYSSLEGSAFGQAQKAQTPDDLAKSTEILKNIADARNSAYNTRFQQILSLLSAVIPLLALFATIYSIRSQSAQFSQTLNQQQE